MITDSESVELELSVTPKAVIVNAGLKGYLRVILDERTINFCKSDLFTAPIGDFDRSLLWRQFYDNILAGKVKPHDFVRAVIAYFETEE